MPAKAEKVIFSAIIRRVREMSDNQLLEIIERYLNGDMSQEERAKFDLLRKENADINSRVTEHQLFAGLLKQYSERVALENRLNAIHEEIDVHTLKENLMVHPSWIVQLWRNHHSKISVAASIALFFVVSILYLTGRFNNNDNTYVELNRKVDKLNRSNESLSRSIHDIKTGKGNTMTDKYSGNGTGFAITPDGLIATNYHVIEGADSVYVQNAAGKSFKAKILYTEPQNDIAILKITDNAFESLNPIPYTIKRGESDLAEKVSTYGYPGSPVYYQGYISSKFGLNGDSLQYQVSSLPINFGNSGGPLWDSKGNIVGITDAKQSKAEGEYFAIKSRYLLDAIHNIPTDSLTERISLNKKNTLTGLSDKQRVLKEKDYVFMVKIYN
jgi:serine protease Do